LASRPSRFTPLERTPGTPRLGGWVGPRAGPEAVGIQPPNPDRPARSQSL